MSLDVYLEIGERRTGPCEHCNGTGTVDHGREQVFNENITHNLNTMAEEAGVYEVMWRPEEIGVAKAGQALPILEAGLARLVENPDKMKKHNPKNGWGTYDVLVRYVRKYIEACREYPDADIRVSR